MASFRFAHMSDVHLDSWRETELKMLNLESFQTAIRLCIEQKIEFLLISGDLFHTAAPDYDIVAKATTELKRLKDSGIRAYVIPGSHDFSYSQKTILNVLENAGLFVNVERFKKENELLVPEFTKDQKTNAKIFGIGGRKGQLESVNFEALDRSVLEKENGLKIFMFHSGIDEYKPKHLEKMECISLNLFPKGFSYYAGGHIHHPFDADETSKGYGKIIMPGALYPVNFDELQKNETGNFLINEAILDQQTGNWGVKTNRIRIAPKNVVYFEIRADDFSARMVEDKLKEQLENSDLKDKIVLLKVHGTLKSGKPADINWQGIEFIARDKGAYVVKRNIHRLVSKEFEEIKIEETVDLKELEKKLIEQHIKSTKIENLDLKLLAEKLMDSIEFEKDDSETATTF